MRNRVVKKGLNRSVVLVAVLFLTMSGIDGQDWPAFRGVDGTGTAKPGGILSKSNNINLKIRWKRELGSGYSSVVVAQDRVVTMFTDGQYDHVICLDKATGETLWQYEIAPAFMGENGSFNGPITTPLIFDSHVYAMDPIGKFVCLTLEEGREVWTWDLVEDAGSVKPLYGFATSPIVVGGTLILQTGVKEKSLAGLDPKTGEVKWETTDDIISSQTPAVVRFQGRDVVVAAGRKKVTGVDPSSGEILFEYEHKGGNGSAMVPVPISKDRVVLTLDDSFSKAFSMRPGDEDKIQVSDEWQDRSIKNTYNVPALSDGNLFAYSTRILTCVDSETGKAHWKSREPGDGFLITIDGHMIINTKKGSLHVSRANSEGYQEVASLDLFDDLCWSVPAYSDNAIFCRNLKDIACVDVYSAEAMAAVDRAEPSATGPEFAKFLVDLHEETDADSKRKRIDDFLLAQKSFPVIEGNVVQFVYRGEGTDVALASDMFGARQEKKMIRVQDTDLFYHAIKLESDQRANYMFLVDYRPQRDDRNPRSMTSSVYAGEMEFAVRLRNEKPLEMSWFAMPDWIEPAYLKTGEELNGTFTSETLESETVESGLDHDVYLPPGYDANPDSRYRTVYIWLGPGGKEHGQIEQAVDQIFSADDAEMEPAILVFVSIRPGPGTDKAFAEELIPAIDAKYRTVATRNGRTTVGFGFAAGAAISVAATYSDRICGASVYSPLVFDAEKAMISDSVSKITEPTEIYIEWGRFDMFNPHENWDAREISRGLFEVCEGNELVNVHGGMVNDSTDWSSWRNRYLEFLKVGSESRK